MVNEKTTIRLFLPTYLNSVSLNLKNTKNYPNPNPYGVYAGIGVGFYVEFCWLT